MEEPLKIFLSHATKDEETMREIAAMLESKGYLCWYAQDRQAIPIGEKYYVEIVEGIDQVDIVLLLHSKHVQDSKWVDKEIEYSYNKNKLILPLMIDDAPLARQLELIVSTMQMLFLHSFPSLETAVDELHERMEDYRIASQDGVHTTGWLNRIHKKTAHTNTVLLGSLTAFQLLPKRLEQLTKTYITVPEYHSLSGALNEERALILHNEQRTGKYTTGLALLQETGVKHVVEILPTATLADLVKNSLKHHTGYIIKNIDPGFFERMTPAVWEELKSKLEQTESYLVLTTSLGAAPPWIGLHQVSIPDSYLVLERHIQEYNGDSTTDIPEQVLSYIKDRLPHEIAEITKHLLPVFNGEKTFADVQHVFESKVQERVSAWFKENGTSLDLVAQYLSLAVLTETTERFYITAVNSLKKTLEASWPAEKMTLMNDRERLQLLNAERFTVMTNTDLSYIQEDAVRLQRPEESKVILLTFWDMFRSVRPQLLQWLENIMLLTKNKEKESAELAVAELANRDMLLVRQELLQKWAKHEDFALRLSTVKILVLLADQHSRLREVSYLLNSWTSQNNNTRLQWTGAAALGTELGFYLYPRSLSMLKHVYMNNQKPLEHAVRQSFTSLYQLGTVSREYDEAFFSFFNDWLDEEKWGSPDTKALVHFFFSIVSQRGSAFTPFNAQEVCRMLYSFAEEALLSSMTKKLVLHLIEDNIEKHPEKFALLVYKLRHHQHSAIQERTVNWLKSGMQSQREASIYMAFYKEIKEYAGRN
ncbi:toll/interleukin-1 receptor domain-containing protein [Fictibacillus aquaticus]|uniref:TIR domain-containing protein n=1 Tax=Fictibacillus aquaticus TaxID=2021314 RepID=A0A235F8R1_9BACL|nr:toll/interleukin-1 receptor domain-containing protein [Fictibacillus aquaticus]OYD57696.1 hypothetical protein CGZ90_13615 [Fictibacillus aquaticus]